MQREIKFRAWYKQYKTMVDVTWIFFDINELDYKGNLNEPKSMDLFKLLQFTGLKDSAGTDIYEGDIIQHNENKYICGFSVVNGQYAYVAINKNLGCFADDFVVKNNHNTRWHSDMWRMGKYIKIIGNIYSNPELLKRTICHN